MPKFAYRHVFEPGSGRESPPLLLLHGTGGNEHDLLRVGRTLSPHSAILSPRGDVNEAGALRFFPRIAPGVYDAQEISRKAQAFADFVVSASKHYGLDASRFVAVGLSTGANMAGALLLLRPEVLAAAVLFRPILVLDLPAAPDSLAGKRVLIATGSTDPLVSADDPLRLEALFRAGGAEVTRRVHAASHALVQADVDAARKWFAAERNRVTVPH